MNGKSRPSFGHRLALIFLALAQGIAGAAIADENRFLLRVDLDGESCPSELVLIESTGCDAREIAEELVAELVVEGFDEKGFNATACQPVVAGATERICWYRLPDGCELLRASVTVEAGGRCVAKNGATGRDLGTLAGFHFFAIDT